MALHQRDLELNPLLDLNARPVIAHRGASGYAPENTIAAFELAAKQGADAFELDVRLTSDAVPVVIHDQSLERTTGLKAKVSALTLAQLREADAGARFSPDRGGTYPFRGAGIVIPTLGEVLRAFPETPLLLELKEEAAQEPVRQLLLDEQAIDRCVLASDQPAALRCFRAGRFSCAACRPEISALYWGALLGKWATTDAGYRLLSVPVRHRGLPVPTRRFVAVARGLGCPVHVWTVNDPSLARRLWSCGVSGIVTDLPDRIRAAR
jgi:glycerophosphoryl diester phosphodiesterase